MGEVVIGGGVGEVTGRGDSQILKSLRDILDLSKCINNSLGKQNEVKVNGTNFFYLYTNKI